MASERILTRRDLNRALLDGSCCSSASCSAPSGIWGYGGHGVYTVA